MMPIKRFTVCSTVSKCELIISNNSHVGCLQLLKWSITELLIFSDIVDEKDLFGENTK